MKNASIILPAYNEMKNIEKVLKDIKSVGNYEIIVVDDGSKDKTTEISKRHAYVIKLEKNHGKGYACRTGTRAARCEKLIFMDADGQLSAKDISMFVNELDNCNVVIGKRSMKNVPIQRRIANKFANWMIKKIIKISLNDCLCGFRAIRKSDFEKLKLTKDFYEFESEMLIKAAKNNFRITEVPVHVNYDDYAGMPFMQSLKVAFYLIRESLK